MAKKIKKRCAYCRKPCRKNKVIAAERTKLCLKCRKKMDRGEAKIMRWFYGEIF